MAIFHLSVKTFSRSSGQNAVAAAAYRAGAKYVDHKTGAVADYTRKQHVASSFLVCPDDAFTDAEQLWNAAESAEKRKNSTIAREYEIALPRELPAHVQEKMAREIAAHISEKYGVAAQGSIHRTDGNPHLHLLTTTRVVGRDGFGAKTRILDDRKTGAAEIIAIKAHWAAMCNRELKLHNSPARVDHRSNAERGLDALPTVHEGTSATALKKRNAYSARASENARRKEVNKLLKIAQREVLVADNAQIDAEHALAVHRETLRTEREVAANEAPPKFFAYKSPKIALNEKFSDKLTDRKKTSVAQKNTETLKKPQKTAGRKKIEAERDRLKKLSITPPWASHDLDRATVETEFREEINKLRKVAETAQKRLKNLQKRHKIRVFLGFPNNEMKAAEHDLSLKKQRFSKLEKNFLKNVDEEVLTRRAENSDWSRKDGTKFHQEFHAVSRLLESENPAIRRAVDAGNLDQARNIALKNREAEQKQIEREIRLEKLISQPAPTRNEPERAARPGGPAPSV